MTTLPQARSAVRATSTSLALLTALLVVVGLLAATAAPSDAAQARRKSAWAAAGTATITPGTQMYTDGSQCTANFVFTDADGGVYVGYAAHCAGTGEATDTDGCQAGSLPLGTPVTFNSGGSLVSNGTLLGSGRLVYSSWLAMRSAGTTDAATCAYNDFALVKVSAGSVGKVNPSVPHFGGPTSLATSGLAFGAKVYSYGSSSLRGGVAATSPKYGVALGDSAVDGGWSHPVYTLTPGIPGDSGSGFLNASGQAVGTLSTVALAPLALSNGVGDLPRELAFAQRHSGIRGLQLAPGTVPFKPLV